jgi:hypothetical protein
VGQFGITKLNMALTVYFKTEKAATTTKFGNAGYLWVDTSIGSTPVLSQQYGPCGSVKFSNIADATHRFYLHIHEPTEPAGDGAIVTDVFTGSETEYSGLGFIKYFTSEAGIFSANTNFSEHECVWTISYMAKYANATAGYSPYIRFYFYKRDTSNNDTLLFYVSASLGTLYSVSPYTVNVVPSGSVTTDDRLRIGVYGGESLPS